MKLLCDFDDDTPKPSTVEEWLWIALCCSIPLSLTLLAPVVLEFRLPPDSEYSRGPSQRRRIPRGYPYEPKKNQSLWFWKDEQKGEGNVIPCLAFPRPTINHAVRKSTQQEFASRAKLHSSYQRDFHARCWADLADAMTR